MKLVDLIVGTRPNFVKMAALLRVIRSQKRSSGSPKYRLIHTGQHYDDRMSDVFFSQLGIPSPDVNLGAGSGTQASQVAKIMTEYERFLDHEKPELCVVVGDVNSTMACSLVAAKMNIPIAHIESGLRSRDRSMPEEVNRVVTDALATWHFTTTAQATNNLIKEGVSESKIFFVGNVMIDTLIENIPLLKKPEIYDDESLDYTEYLVLTMHRPSNVQEITRLKAILAAVHASAGDRKVIFPVHPRLEATIDKMDLNLKNLILIQPLSYLEFIYLIKSSLGVVTDSGGVSEETTFLGIPCITLRDTTERPETVEIGTNKLVGGDLNALSAALKEVVDNRFEARAVPEKWDGRSSRRIIDIFENVIFKN